MKLLQRLVLLPFETLYRMGIGARNWYYNIVGGHKVPVKVISIGNISTGGTGKTPMAEWLLSYAQELGIHAAYLSRGYKRKTSGFILVNPQTHTAEEVGDEALQVANNFNAPVAVCENRVHGCKKLLDLFPNLQLIILDDAFQHRKIHRDLDLITLDPAQSPYEDYLLPTGNLREPSSSLKRADLIVITKSNLVTNSTLKKILNHLPKSVSRVKAPLISTHLINCFDPNDTYPLENLKRNPCYALSAIGNNQLFIQQLFKTNLNVIQQISFKDHHNIPENAIQKAVKECKKWKTNSAFTESPMIVITEKDYYRMKNQPYFTEQEIPIYYLKVKLAIEEVPHKLENCLQSIISSAKSSSS